MKLEKYRPTMTVDVLHSWAADAQDTIARQSATIKALTEAMEEIRNLHGIPEYHGHAMGCGVEDRCLQSDGYGGAEYGWEDAAERFCEWATGMAEHALAQAREEE